MLPPNPTIGFTEVVGPAWAAEDCHRNVGIYACDPFLAMKKSTTHIRFGKCEDGIVIYAHYMYMH